MEAGYLARLQAASVASAYQTHSCGTAPDSNRCSPLHPAIETGTPIASVAKVPFRIEHRVLKPST